MTSIPVHGSFPTPWAGSLGIIGAMESEVELLMNSLELACDIELGSVRMTAGELCGAKVVVAKSGVGKVNAASATMALVALGVAGIVNTGAAGSLSDELSVGDFVVATDCVHHDVDVCNLGYELGQVPGMPVAFEIDSQLTSQMAHAIGEVTGSQVRQGRIVSGDSFVRDSDERQRIATLFGALCCDMESAAIGQVCTGARVPFAVVRAISDLADGSMPESYLEFETKAAHASARALMALLGA